MKDMHNNKEKLLNYNYSYSSMSTTIQVSNTTKQVLEMMKVRKHASSYDEVIQNLMKLDTKVPKSMFGSAKGLGKWKKSDRMVFREL